MLRSLLRPSRTLLLAAALLAGCVRAGSTYPAQAEQFMAEHKLPEAVLAYRQALRSDPENTDLLRGLEAALEAQGRDRSAALVLDQAIARLPDDAALREARARLTLKPQDGLGLKLSWFYDGGTEPVGAAVAAGRVFIAYSGGHMIVLDEASGRVLWHVASQSLFSSAPAADAEQVWVGAQDGTIQVYDAATGAALGSVRTGAAVYAAPALAASVAYCPSSDGTLYAVDRASFTVLWKAALGDALHASPLATPEAVYVGANNGRLYAFHPTSGERLWANSFLTQGAVESVPVLDNGRLYVGSDDGRLYALDAATGREAWHFSTPDAVYAPPLSLGGQVIVASSGQMLASVQAADGTAAWKLAFDHALAQPPVLFHEQLYLAARGDPRLFSVEPATGKLLGELDTGDWIASGPFASGGDLVLVGQDGSVYLYR